MRIINYDKEMEKIINTHSTRGEKPKLLLHSCCAPCSTACIEKLKEFFELTVYFYNPNLDSEEEFSLRAKEQVRYCESALVDVYVEKYVPQEFYNVVKGLEHVLEGGARCEKCFYLRLKRTAEKAKELGFDYFTTTLTVSPLKNATKLNQIGQNIEREGGVKFLPTDFKKNYGYDQSLVLSNKYDLYRQHYCGCEFSKVGE